MIGPLFLRLISFHFRPKFLREAATDGCSYTQQDLSDAYQAVFEKNVPVERAEKRFGVPITTLKERVREKVHVDTVKSEGLLEGASAGVSGTMSKSGWSNTKIFSQYMQEHLIKYLPARSENSYALVLYDGHKSHVSLPLIEWAKENYIILFVLSPHCSHSLQPLDVSCYGPFEIAWNSACHSHLRESGRNTVS